MAGLLATQNPGKESKIPTFASPPYCGFGIVVEVGTEELVDVGTVVLGAVVVSTGSVVELLGRVVCAPNVVVVSDVFESEHAATNKDVATRRLTIEFFFWMGRRIIFMSIFLW